MSPFGTDQRNPTPDNSLGFEWPATSPDDLNHISLTLNPYMELDPYKEVCHSVLATYILDKLLSTVRQFWLKNNIMKLVRLSIPT